MSCLTGVRPYCIYLYLAVSSCIWQDLAVAALSVDTANYPKSHIGRFRE